MSRYDAINITSGGFMNIYGFMEKYNLTEDVRKELIECVLASCSFSDKSPESKKSSKSSDYAPYSETVLCYGERIVSSGAFNFVFRPVSPDSSFDVVAITMTAKEVSEKFFSGGELTEQEFSHKSKFIVGNDANVFAIVDTSESVIFAVSIKRKSPNRSCVPECVGFEVHSLR